jgi:hypothetical protein
VKQYAVNPASQFLQKPQPMLIAYCLEEAQLLTQSLAIVKPTQFENESLRLQRPDVAHPVLGDTV